jgi:hypothetical protein
MAVAAPPKAVRRNARARAVLLRQTLTEATVFIKPGPRQPPSALSCGVDELARPDPGEGLQVNVQDHVTGGPKPDLAGDVVAQ